MSRTGTSRGMLRLCVCLAMWAAIGCNTDECEPREQRCDGMVLLTCHEGSCHDPSCAFSAHRRWWRETCRDACVEKNQLAFCALSATEDPLCKGAERCEDNAAVSCLAGHAIARRPCENAVCVTTDWGEPICAHSSTPSPLCAALSQLGTVCDASTLLICHGKYVESARACQFACVMPGDSAFCAAAASSDPRCEAPLEEWTAVSCPDGTPGICREGFVQCLSSPEIGVDIDAGSG